MGILNDAYLLTAITNHLVDRDNAWVSFDNRYADNDDHDIVIRSRMNGSTKEYVVETKNGRRGITEENVMSEVNRNNMTRYSISFSGDDYMAE